MIALRFFSAIQFISNQVTHGSAIQFSRSHYTLWIFRALCSLVCALDSALSILRSEFCARCSARFGLCAVSAALPAPLAKGAGDLVVDMTLRRLKRKMGSIYELGKEPRLADEIMMRTPMTGGEGVGMEARRGGKDRLKGEEE